ncbi:leucine-rich repeat transmembrane protein FLRT1-like [Amblyomma americanum]
MKITLFLFIVIWSSVRGGPEFTAVCPRSCQCGDNLRVISCAHQQLHSFPQPLPDNIEELDVSFNTIDSIPSLAAHRIIKITLCHNHVSAILRGTFAHTNLLQNLDLSHNCLSSLAADDLDGLESLRNLDLRWNDLRKLEHYAFHRVPNLKTLKLSGNPLRYVDSSWFKNLDVLEVLELRAIGAYSLAADAFLLAPRLQVIDLSENDFSDVPSALGSARNLRILTMDQNPVMNLSRTALSGVKNLEELHMSNMPRLESVDKGSLWNMRHLALVNMSYNVRLKVISDSALQWIKSPVLEIVVTNNSLQTLDYAFSGLCDAGLLNLDGNPWLCDCKILWMRSCNATQDLRCSGPLPLAGKAIGHVKPSEMSCPLSQSLLQRFEETASNKLVLATVGVCALSVTLAAGVCIWRGRRRGLQKDARYSAVHYSHVTPKN